MQTQNYATVRNKDGQEVTVSLRDLAPLGQRECSMSREHNQMPEEFDHRKNRAELDTCIAPMDPLDTDQSHICDQSSDTNNDTPESFPVDEVPQRENNLSQPISLRRLRDHVGLQIDISLTCLKLIFFFEPR